MFIHFSTGVMCPKDVYCTIRILQQFAPITQCPHLLSKLNIAFYKSNLTDSVIYNYAAATSSTLGHVHIKFMSP